MSSVSCSCLWFFCVGPCCRLCRASGSAPRYLPTRLPHIPPYPYRLIPACILPHVRAPPTPFTPLPVMNILRHHTFATYTTFFTCHLFGSCLVYIPLDCLHTHITLLVSLVLYLFIYLLVLSLLCAPRLHTLPLLCYIPAYLWFLHMRAFLATSFMVMVYVFLLFMPPYAFLVHFATYFYFYFHLLLAWHFTFAVPYTMCYMPCRMHGACVRFICTQRARDTIPTPPTYTFLPSPVLLYLLPSVWCFLACLPSSCTAFSSCTCRSVFFPIPMPRLCCMP